MISTLVWEKVRDDWEYARIKGHRTVLHIVRAQDSPDHCELWALHPISHIGTFATMDDAKVYARTYVGDDEE